jgi:hypothetical protein
MSSPRATASSALRSFLLFCALLAHDSLARNGRPAVPGNSLSTACYASAHLRICASAHAIRPPHLHLCALQLCEHARTCAPPYPSLSRARIGECTSLQGYAQSAAIAPSSRLAPTPGCQHAVSFQLLAGTHECPFVCVPRTRSASCAARPPIHPACTRARS